MTSEMMKIEKAEPLFKEFIPKYFSILEKRITANNGWMHKNKLTYVDISSSSRAELC